MTDAHIADENGGIASLRWTIPLAVTALLSMLCVLRYHLYLAQGWDLGFYEQGLWALYHEGFHAWSSWGQFPVLSRSMAWILWPLSFPYHVFGLGFLLTLQAFSYGIGFLFVYDWMRYRQYSWKKIRLIGWLYLINPIAWGLLLFDFHPAVLAIPAIIASITLMDRGMNRQALFWLALALACQDVATLMGVTLALVWIGQRKMAVGLGALILSVLVATLDFFAMSHLGDGTSVQRTLYLQHAGLFATLDSISRVRVLEYITWMFIPTIILGVTQRSFKWLVPIAVIVAVNLGAANALATSPFSSFSILAVPFILVALAEGASSRTTAKTRLRVLIYVSFFAALFWYEAGLLRLAPSINQRTALSEAITKIPTTASVITQNQIAPHVANRSELISLSSTNTYPQGDFVILDINHSTSLSISQLRAMMTRFAHAGHVIYSYQGIYVFRLSHSVSGGRSGA